MIAPGNSALTITPNELELIVRQAFGERTNIRATRRMTTGSVNRTSMVTLDSGNRVIVRIGPGESQVTDGPSWLTSFGLRREQVAIDLLRESLAVLPVTLAHDFNRATIDGDWVVQQVMPGDAWSGIVPSLPEANQHDLWQQLGNLVHRIHAVTGIAFGPPAWGANFPAWPDLILADLDGLTRDAQHYHLDLAPFAALRDLVISHREELSRVPPQLIHSDLSLDHVFVEQQDQHWRISGVIDLEFARFADIASEGLLLELLNRHDAEADAFFTGYGDRPDIPPIRQTVASMLNNLWRLTDTARLQRHS